MARVGDESQPSRRRLHPLVHRSGRLADVTGSTDPVTAVTTAPAALAEPVSAAEPATPSEPEPGLAAEPAPPAEPRQRWRLTFARDPVPADQVGRAVLDAWQATLAGSGLAAASGAAELADLWLLERRPLWALREGLVDRLPAGHRWVAAEDIWLGEPALAGRVSAADWRIELAGPGADRVRIGDAARQLIAARSLPRIRRKGTTEKGYDLRLLLEDIAVDDATGPAPVLLRVRTRLHPELGAGRPEEVVAALAESVGVALEIAALARVGLVLGDAPPARERPTGFSRR